MVHFEIISPTDVHDDQETIKAEIVPQKPNHSAMDVTSTSTTRVNLVLSSSRLLSGRALTDCRHADDPSCSGGVAAVAAYARSESVRSSNNDGTELTPTLVIPQFDFQSPFIQQHPLQWAANRLVLQHLLGWKLFLARSWFLNTGGREQSRDISPLQTKQWPLLISNVAVPSTNSWYHYTKGVFLDQHTNLAIISIVEEIDVSNFHHPQIQSAKNMLDFIHIQNNHRGCQNNDNHNHNDNPYQNIYQLYIQNYTNTQSRPPASSNNNGKNCWIPVIVADLVSYQNNTLLQALTEYKYPPALFWDYGGVNPLLTQEPKLFGDKTWALGFRTSGNFFQQVQLRTYGHGQVINATLKRTDITQTLPEQLKDDLYRAHIDTLRQYADETIANDPIVGQAAHHFPLVKADGIVRCEAGECEAGNLFTDALRWHTQADFAFANSGAYHGSGWPAGPIRVSQLWETLPFANTLCTGIMSGISMFRMFNFSTSSATFSGADTVAGGDLMQVSGVRLTYNTQLVGSRLVGLDIWNQTQQEYQPVERLQMYKFASDSYNCLFNDPFNQFTGSLLTIPGESPGKVNQDLEQEVVASFLSQLEQPYDGSISGRLVNDTTIKTHIHFVQTEENCDAGTSYWLEDYTTCFECPRIDGVSIVVADEGGVMQLEGVSGDPTVDSSSVAIRNDGEFAVDVIVKSTPQFLHYTGSMAAVGNQRWIAVDAGGTLTLPFGASGESMSEGSALGEVAIGVSDGGGEFPGCVGDDLRFEVNMSVLPQAQLNQLGSIRAVGWTLAAIVLFTSLVYSVWCVYFRRHFVVRSLQPMFLLLICGGVFVMGSALIPLSFDDEIASPEGMSIACSSIPWLLSVGFTVAFSALYSKLRRINILFLHTRGLRRAVVKERDVLVPFAILLSANIAVLVTWQVVDPLQYHRVPLDGEPWSSVGVCDGSRENSRLAFYAAIGGINAVALGLAVVQAYLARNLSLDFSEAGNMGMAIFSWVQFSIVGIPVLFLIEETNTTARYFVQITLLFAVCISLLLWIFIPLTLQWWKKRGNPRSQSTVHVSGVRPTPPNSSMVAKYSLTASNTIPHKSTLPMMPSHVENEEEQQNQAADALSDISCESFADDSRG
ncbi:Gamma-aminobutyric acid (GABA) B receptor [Seminavis robusta]|uniref:Gamma-aminobutyric acid (GABA) B receptor n=1 Tax=Seminavis robusta TaxID=568900 RepID=A0A9N8DUK6_9STRA|nr:Gamma-aminobutyric acid (GABA) B receptor [Seminavis robusta]|eukprot:Sro362_g126750.1 Gamma-aminobutyric acid (GABA) B receptor (1115) ;mRNA; f:36447-39902